MLNNRDSMQRSHLQWRHVSVVASRIICNSTVCSTICSGVQQLNLCITGLLGWPVQFPHKAPVTCIQDMMSWYVTQLSLQESYMCLAPPNSDIESRKSHNTHRIIISYFLNEHSLISIVTFDSWTPTSMCMNHMIMENHTCIVDAKEINIASV